MAKPADEARIAGASRPAEEALRIHPFYRGKLQTMPKCAVRGLEDFSIWYTPGVAAPCRAIEREPELVYEHTNRGNTVARAQGIARRPREREELLEEGRLLMRKARDATAALMREEIIARPPD